MASLPSPNKRVREVSILVTASSIGLALVIAIFLGAGAGWWLDKFLGTTPWCFIIGLLLGVVAGYRNIYILAKRLDRSQEETHLANKKKDDQ
ncbi:MAG: AtpZ/AtpI family protein [Deltaproteobacteria bacterium]|jgi:ATP synthase protein I|nr:AtpZ/AtpI family protein [Deltaproteobacteria bacterium]